jgi:hypothetical protein
LGTSIHFINVLTLDINTSLEAIAPFPPKQQKKKKKEKEKEKEKEKGKFKQK